MSITVDLVFASKYRLRYRITRGPGGIAGGDIPNVGGASPDISTDLAAAGAADEFLKLLTTEVADTAAAQAIMDADSRLIVLTRKETGAKSKWRAIGVTQSNPGRPTLNISFDSTAGIGADGDTLLVDIQFTHTINR